MDFINSIFSSITSINWEVIAQLTMLGLVVLSGPLVIFLLSTRSGDL